MKHVQQSLVAGNKLCKICFAVDSIVRVKKIKAILNRRIIPTQTTDHTRTNSSKLQPYTSCEHMTIFLSRGTDTLSCKATVKLLCTPPHPQPHRTPPPPTTPPYPPPHPPRPPASHTHTTSEKESTYSNKK